VAHERAEEERRLEMEAATPQERYFLEQKEKAISLGLWEWAAYYLGLALKERFAKTTLRGVE